jgi:pteridine reductase
MERHNRGKVALITGGAKRVGRAVALDLAEHGFDVALTYRQSAEAAAEVVREVRKKRRSAVAIEADLAEPTVGEAVRSQFAQHFGRLDALVHNAAVFSQSPLGQIEADRYDRDQAINARAPLLLTQAFGDRLKAHYTADDPASAGRVVNLVDMHVLGRPRPGYASYAASKAALLQLNETLALELAPAVTVNAIAPGVVAWADDYTEQDKADYLQRVPLGRPGTVTETAAAVRFLITEAHYTTGEVVRLDGGRWLG